MLIKLFVVLALVAVAAASPTPCHLLKEKGIIRGGNLPLPIALPKPKLGLGPILLGKCSLGGHLRALFKTLIGHKHYARQNMNDILNMKVGSFNDVCYLLSRLVVSLCDTLEASIRGLGYLLSRVIFIFLRIIICFVGRAGSGNPFCRNDINLLVGVKDVAVSDEQGLIDAYDLRNAPARLNLLIYKYTRGRGIKGCRGSLRIVLQLVLDFINRLQMIIARSGTLSKADFKFCFHKITCLLGVIGNSHQKALGLEIINDFVPMCNQFIISAGYPDCGDYDQVRRDVQEGNDDRAPWAMPDIEGVTDTSVTISLGGLIGNLFKGLIGVTRLASNLIQEILGFVINTVEDVFTLVIKIMLGLGGALDATIAGLGSLLVRIVAGLLKIVLCFHGTGKYGICRPGWDRQVGVSGDCSSMDLVIRRYGLSDCHDQVNQHIYKYTKGGGIESTSGSIRIFLQICVTLSQTMQYRKFDSSTIVIVITHVTYGVGAIGNSNSKGVGTTVCNKFISDTNKILSQAGYPGLGNSQANIMKVVEDANNDDYTWCADIDEDNSQPGFIEPRPQPEPQPTPSPVRPTAGPVRPTEGPVRPTEGPIRPTPGPVRPTPGPVRPTEGPVGPTERPVRPTEGPVRPTEGPVRPTEGPVRPTAGPIRPTEGPVRPTDGPVRPTPGPVRPTESPVRPTEGPVRPTPGPVRPTPGPVRPTEGPVRPTEGPVKPTPGPVRPTENPVRPTEGPVRPTPGPVRPTEGPVRPTAGPVRPTEGTVRPTPGPVRPTEGPVRPTEGPIRPTPGPVRPTEGPVMPTPGPVRPTEGPVRPTPGPVKPSKPASLGELFKIIFGSIRGVTKLAFNALNIITSITINTLNDVCSLIINLTLVLEVILNNLVVGLGSFFSRLVACIVKIGICVNGFPGDRNVCTRDFNKRYGFTGDSNKNDDLVVFFKLGKAQEDFNDMVSRHTRGKGIKSIKQHALRYILERISRLVVIITNYKAITRQIMAELLVIITSISASVGNSRQRNCGKQIIEKLLSQCGNVIEKEGYPDITSQVTDITKDCDDSNDDNTDWDGGDNGDTPPSGGDKGNTSPSPAPLGGLFKIIFGSIRGVSKLAFNALNIITSITINTLNDVFSLLINLTLVLEVILNNLVVGLGSFFSRLVACIVKIGICVNGFPGDRNICTRDFNKRYGFTGDSNKDDDFVVFFKLGKAQEDFNDMVSRHTRGKGIKSIKQHALRYILERISRLVVVITNYKKGITRHIIAELFVIITSISASVGNSRQRNCGKQIIEKLLPQCGKVLENEKYPDITIQVTVIIKDCDDSNDDKTDFDGGDNENPPPSGGDNGTSPSPGGDNGNTSPSGGDNGTTPSPGGDNGNTSPSGEDNETSPSPGGDNGNTSPSGEGNETSPSPGGDNGNTTPSGGDNGNTPSSGDNNGNDNDCGKDIGGVIQVIPGVTKLSSTIIRQIIKIKITTLTDIVELITKLAIVLGGIIDCIVDGLGSILIRLVAVIYKIGICVNGYSSNRGSICTKEWNEQWGCVGEGNTEVDLIAVFRCNDSKSTVTKIIDKHTGGKGIESTKGFIKYILQVVLEIANIVSSGTITKEHFINVFIYIISIFGSITNNYKQGSATTIIQRVISVCAQIFLSHGCSDIRPRQETIISNINVVANVRFDWTTVQVGDNSQADTNAALNAVLNFETPRSFEDTMFFGVKVVKGLGGIIDVYINGLGSLILRIVGCLIHYIVAVLGGARNAKSFVSQKAYFETFEVSNCGNTWDDHAKSFKITEFKKKLDDIMDSYTNKKGRGSLSGAEGVCFDVASNLAAIAGKGSAIVEGDLTPVMCEVTTLLCAFGNSVSAGIGKTIVDNMVPACSHFMEQNNYPSLASQQSKIIQVSDKCNNVRAPWTSSTTTVEVQEN